MVFGIHTYQLFLIASKYSGTNEYRPCDKKTMPIVYKQSLLTHWQKTNALSSQCRSDVVFVRSTLYGRLFYKIEELFGPVIQSDYGALCMTHEMSKSGFLLTVTNAFSKFILDLSCSLHETNLLLILSLNERFSCLIMLCRLVESF